MATSTSSISGLSSGLDTASIISQLMLLEAQPQNRLKTQLGTQQSTVQALQSLNAQIAALATQATDAGKANAWSPQQVTSSLAGVTVTSTGSPTTLDVHVQQLATATKVTFDPASATDVVVTGSPVELTVGTTTTTLSTGSGTLGSVAAAINAGSYGVGATVVTLSDGTQRLSLQSTTTGAASTFSLSNVGGLGSPTTTAGQDATIVVGADTLTSSSNTFTAISGLELTISAAAVGQDAHIDVVADKTAAAAKAKSLVDNINAALTQIDTLTSYNPTTKTQGLLSSDAAAGSLRGALFAAVFPTDGTSLSSVGIQSDRYGKLVFDAGAFSAAYAADPGKVTSALSGGSGFVDRIGAVAKAASDSISGSLTGAISGHNVEIQRTQDSIADWDVRLALRQSTLTQQYTNLETTLNQLNSQSSWLAGQLGALSTSK